MNKKLIGFILIIVIAIVAINGCAREQKKTLIVFERKVYHLNTLTFIPNVFSHLMILTIVYEEYEKEEVLRKKSMKREGVLIEP